MDILTTGLIILLALLLFLGYFICGGFSNIFTILAIILLVIVIIRTVKSKRQIKSDKEERKQKNKMIDDYIKEITDNNHNAEK
ncbi:MAG: hypothetical protein V8R67_03215 [Eubacterium sp.]